MKGNWKIPKYTDREKSALHRVRNKIQSGFKPGSFDASQINLTTAWKNVCTQNLQGCDSIYKVARNIQFTVVPAKVLQYWMYMHMQKRPKKRAQLENQTVFIKSLLCTNARAPGLKNSVFSFVQCLFQSKATSQPQQQIHCCTPCMCFVFGYHIRNKHQYLLF